MECLETLSFPSLLLVEGGGGVLNITFLLVMYLVQSLPSS